MVDSCNSRILALPGGVKLYYASAPDSIALSGAVEEKSLVLQSGSNAEVALNILKDAVAKTTSPLDVASLEGETQAFGRCVGLVHGYVAPPHAAVVPQVVVEVIVIDTKRDLGLLRGHFK